MTTHRHLPALDGLRGFAILLVFILHYGGGAQSHNPVLYSVGLLIEAGWSGVTLFFVLSGFLISGILWDSNFRGRWWRNFYIRRVLRIFPLYYAALLLAFLSALVRGYGLFSLSRIWIYLCYLQNMPYLQVKASNIGSPFWLSHFWSLAVEEQFYLLWPFLLMRMKSLSQARALCLGSFVFSAVFRICIWSVHRTGMFDGFLITRAGELAIGAYLAMCYRDQSLWNRIRARAPLVLILSLMTFLIAGIAGHSLRLQSSAIFVIGLPCITVFYGALLVASLGNGIVNRLACFGWLRWFGGISYGFYIFHVLFIPVFEWIVSVVAPRASRDAALLLNFIIAFVLSTLVSWASFRFFETPFLRLKSRFAIPQTSNR